MVEPLILAIETATRSGSVAVSRGDRILSAREGKPSISHSTNLLEMVEQALSEAGAQLSDIELFAAAVGPGSFTGLRIGLATIKAFAVCSKRKVAGVSTLTAIAHAARAEGELVSLLPAGRGELFAQLFSVEQGSVEPLDVPAHLSPKALLEKYGERRSLKWSGEGAQQQLETLKDFAEAKGLQFGTGAEDSPGWTVVPGACYLADSVAILAARNCGSSMHPDELRATYVRASDAEINERWQQEKALQPAQS